MPATLPSRAEVIRHIGIEHMVNNSTHIYLCHQTLFKLLPSFDAVFRFVASDDALCMYSDCGLRRILERDPDGILVLKV